MNRLTREKKEGMLILSLHKSSSRRIASELVKEGNPVGVFNRGVCAIWGDGRNKLFYQEVVRIKGEKRNKKPLATSIKTEDFVRFIDASKIPKSLHEIFTDPKRLKLRIGSLCFMRLPIKASIARELPHYIISKCQAALLRCKIGMLMGTKR